MHVFFTPQAGKSGDIKAIVQIQLAGTYVAFAQQLHQGGRQTTVMSASADSSADSGGGSDAGVGSGGRLEEQSAVGSELTPHMWPSMPAVLVAFRWCENSSILPLVPGIRVQTS